MLTRYESPGLASGRGPEPPLEFPNLGVGGQPGL